MVDRTIRDAVEQAALDFPVAADALAFLDRAFDGWRSAIRTSSADAPRAHTSRAVRALAGLYLRAGMISEAAELLLPYRSPEDRVETPAVLIDPNYHGIGGHYHQANRFYLAATEQAGLDCTYLHADIRTPDIGVLARRPHLRTLSRKHFFAGRTTVDDVLAVNRLFARQFQQILPTPAPRLVVVPTPTDAFIEGLAFRLSETASRPISLLLGLHEPKWGMTRPDWKIAAYRQAFDHLEKMRDLRVLVVAESEPIAAGFRQKISDRHTVIAGPSVGAYVDDMGQPRLWSGGSITVGFVGRDVPQRGGELVPGIAVRTLAARPDIRWRAQIGMPASTDADRDDKKRLARDDRFEVVPATLSNPDYYDLVSSIDIMVMPFDHSYSVRASGVASECLRLGSIMIVPERSTMAAFAEEHNAGYVTFAERSPDAVAAAILDAASQFEDLRMRSHAAAQRFMDRNDTVKQINEFIAAA